MKEDWRARKNLHSEFHSGASRRRRFHSIAALSPLPYRRSTDRLHGRAYLLLGRQSVPGQPSKVAQSVKEPNPYSDQAWNLEGQIVSFWMPRLSGGPLSKSGQTPKRPMQRDNRDRSNHH
jgi:hypothetical protein